MSTELATDIAAERLAADPQSVFEYYTLTTVVGDESRDSMRFAPTFEGGEGYRELIELGDGFMMLLGDLHYAQDIDIDLKEDASLKFHYRLSGVSEIELPEERFQIGQHTGGVLLNPDGVVKHEHVTAGEHEKSVTLICSAGFLKARLGDSSTLLPAAIREYISGKRSPYFCQHVPLRASMATTAASLFDSQMEGPLRNLFALSRGLELLALSLQSLAEAEQDCPDGPERGIHSRDLKRLQDAREILDENFIEPPTINRLARKVGINEAKLMHCFKQLYGLTIFDYAQSMRMEKAKQLLESTDLSITEIAFEVGYEYSSNFTTAFKRQFGITPSAARDATQSS